jgi:hypothetical protein
VFNRTQIDTGFKPTVHLHTYISADTKDLDQYDKDIEDAYTGANGRGIFHTFGTQDENAPVLNVLERGDHAGELDAIREAAEAVVVRGYGVPDLLYRMDVVGGLTSAGNAMKAAADQFMEGFVKPKQQMITKDLVRLMNAEGINVWNAEIIELQLFDDASEAEPAHHDHRRAARGHGPACARGRAWQHHPGPHLAADARRPRQGARRHTNNTNDRWPAVRPRS